MSKHRKKHFRSRVVGILLPLLTILAISGILISINTKSQHKSFAASVASPPNSIASNCSVDVTDSLKAWFASLPSNTTVNLPTNACYLVSNDQAKSNDVFIIQNTNGLTVNGNGASFKQTNYNLGEFQPIVTIGSNTNLTMNDFSSIGPANAGGPANEGDYGIYMYKNNGVTFDHMTINGPDGDGMAIYDLGNEPGVNYNVVVNNSTVENVGYHGLTPEAVHGFTFENSTLGNGDIDAEVDFACDGLGNDPPVGGCGTLDSPNIGVVDMTFENSSFPSGFILLQGMSCMPIGNWSVINNNFGNGGMNLEFGTSYNTSLQSIQLCGRPSGLTVTGNTGTGTSLLPCCGSGSTFGILQGWTDVVIANNNLVYDVNRSLGGSGPLDMWDDNNVKITNNRFINVYNYPDNGNGPSPWPANTNILSCGNTWGQLAGLIHEPACSVTSPKVSLSTSTNSVARGSPVNLSVSVSDTVPVSSVEFIDNFSPLVTDTSSPYSYTWNTSNITSVGNHTITAVVIDSDGTIVNETATVNVSASSSSGGSGTSGSSTTSSTGSTTISSGGQGGTKANTNSQSTPRSSGKHTSSSSNSASNTSNGGSGSATATGGSGGSGTGSQTTSYGSSTTIPVVSASRNELRNVYATKSGKVIIDIVIGFIALVVALATLKIWKAEWDPLWWWKHVVHHPRYAGSSDVVVGGAAAASHPSPIHVVPAAPKAAKEEPKVIETPKEEPKVELPKSIPPPPVVAPASTIKPTEVRVVSPPPSENTSDEKPKKASKKAVDPHHPQMDKKYNPGDIFSPEDEEK